MTALFNATGMVIWGIMGLGVLWLIGELGWALAVSISFHRWSYACAKAHGRLHTLKWAKLPVSILSFALKKIGYRKGQCKYYREDGSEWRGIGDWQTGWGKV